MPAYNFKAVFVAPILAGTKVQTIRGDRRRHARPGEPIYIFTAMRTKHCRRIGSAICTSIQPITIDLQRHSIADGRGERLTTIDDLDSFAARDGFHGWAAMRRFWELHHPTTPIFTGVLIHWTDFQPAHAPFQLTRPEASRNQPAPPRS